jgi:hypothetical protein
MPWQAESFALKKPRFCFKTPRQTCICLRQIDYQSNKNAKNSGILPRGKMPHFLNELKYLDCP